MYDLVVSEHYPSINQNNVYRDVTIEITFDKEIDTSLVNDNNIIVTDYIYTSVAGSVGWKYTDAGTPNGKAKILTFKANTFLDPETTYIVTIPKYPNSVMSTDGSFLQQNYTFRFNTGVGFVENSEPTTEEMLRADLAKAIANEDWNEAARINNILNHNEIDGIIDDVIDQPLLSEYLVVNKTNPKNGDSDIPLDKLKFIKIKFNDIIPDDIDYNGFVTVISKNVLE
jgi:hypothetical protein